MKYEMTKTITYIAPKTGQKIKLQVGEYGSIYYNKRLLKTHMINEQQGYLYAAPPAEANFNGLLPVHRLVALAWVKGRTVDNNQVFHKDNNKLNNCARNLVWATKRDVHGTPIARKKTRKGARHFDECIKATKGSEVRYFKNGKEAANAIGCTHPLIYLVLNPNHYAKTAKGWALEWVKIEEVKGKGCPMYKVDIED